MYYTAAKRVKVDFDNRAVVNGIIVQIDTRSVRKIFTEGVWIIISAIHFCPLLFEVGGYEIHYALRKDAGICSSEVGVL